MPNPLARDTPIMEALLKANHEVRRALATWEFASISERHAAETLAALAPGDIDYYRLSLAKSRAMGYADEQHARYDAALETQHRLNATLRRD